MPGVLFTAILTGTPDSTTDLTLPLLTMTASLRDSTDSFISITVPWAYFDEVNARPNGDIQLYKNGSLLYTVNFNTFRYDQGARSRTLTLSGRSTASFGATETVTLDQGVESDSKQANDKRVLVVNPIHDVIPGDTVSYDAVNSVIERVQYTSNNSGTRLTLTEQ
jgi:hypothetical protein